MGKKTKNKKITADYLRKIGVKEVLIPGLLLAGVLGWKGWEALKTNYYNNPRIFPATGVVGKVYDGDTFELQNGVRVRMIGINAPDRGERGYETASDYLSDLLTENRVWLEYDRYQDDKNGRILAWVWIDCESKPGFMPPDYMHLSRNQSRSGLLENPEGCRKGTLVQEKMIKTGLASFEVYKDRGELKYEARLK